MESSLGTPPLGQLPVQGHVPWQALGPVPWPQHGPGGQSTASNEPEPTNAAAPINAAAAMTGHVNFQQPWPQPPYDSYVPYGQPPTPMDWGQPPQHQLPGYVPVQAPQPGCSPQWSTPEHSSPMQHSSPLGDPTQMAMQMQMQEALSLIHI